MRFLCCAAAALALCAGQPANAFYAWEAEEAPAPPGWKAFCLQLPQECVVGAGPVHYILTPGSWQELVKINKRVNNLIVAQTDHDHYGVLEHWAYPDDGVGDCEDYVLLKRRLLMERGWPSSALLITIVLSSLSETHAVLIARTDQADFVLDNLTDAVLVWSKTSLLRYYKRQSQEDPNVWVRIKQDPSAVGALRRP